MSRMVYSRSKAAMISSIVVVSALLGGCSARHGKAPRGIGPGITGSIKPVPGGKNSIGSVTNVRASKFARQTTRLSKAFERNPADSKTALRLIYALRTLNMNQQAAAILHRAYAANPKDPSIASEYGRFLLGTGKTTQAQRVLARIGSPAEHDWHTLSAMGTLEARAGHYAKATALFRKAHNLAPKQVSVINNLALALALDGKPGEAENLLRNADDSGRFGARLRQNLALVLALQGKYDQARDMATTDLPPQQAEANIAYLKRMLGTGEARNGVELSDETRKPMAKMMASSNRDANISPIVTGSIPAHKISKEKEKTEGENKSRKPAPHFSSRPVSLSPLGETASLRGSTSE